ncbi:hypothetical protein [Bosea sp. ANAM02]|uniref:hypothetical protein n=1 Tax=Bosea sp. ANAM02 TaxID=2020412 RepID=UPI00140EFB60|nr:hypothetical protein [Bosea sp. ANAM02]BCB19540.1 hypothetical protein OCUBac02_24340 [Bosea sp. ANAM02]
MSKMDIPNDCLPMFSLYRFAFDLIELVTSDALAAGMERRQLVKREAATLIERCGSGAFDIAQNVVQLARRRDDADATKLWLDVAREIARRDAKSRR